MEVLRLIQFEFYRNWRQPRSWVTTLLFVLSSMMVLYFGFNRMRPETWGILFWILLLFSGVSSVIGEDTLRGTQERFLLVQWTSAISSYLSKLLYHAIILCLICLLQWLTLSAFFGQNLPVNGHSVLLLCVGALSLSIVFCFVGAIVSAAEKGSSMATLLAFPLIIPTLLLLIRMTFSAMQLLDFATFYQDLWTLLGLDAILLGLGLFLYPQIWKS